MGVALDILYLAWNRLAFTKASFTLLLRNTDWSLVDRLVVYDDGSTDGTADWLYEACRDARDLGVEIEFEAREPDDRYGSPVAVMNDYVEGSAADWFAKIDNDIAVPPGWLPTMLGVVDGYPYLDALGMEAGRTGMHPPESLSQPVYRPEPCSHIGGVGLIRTAALKGRQVSVSGRYFGWTETQSKWDLNRAFITPDILCPQLDRVPVEPWASWSAEYLERGWQRRWPSMHPVWSAPYFDWLEEALCSTGST